MTDQEVHKIIAEFMEKYCVHMETAWIPDYTKSLDALVPVWRKLRMFPMISEYRWKYQVNLGFTSHGVTCDTVQQAAAHATAKAIKELNEKK